MTPSEAGWSNASTLDPAERDAGVEEREHRNDQQGYPGPQIVLDALQHGSVADLQGNAPRNYHAGECRMHTGLQHGDPHQHACQQVGSDSGDAEAIESDQAADPERGGRQVGGRVHDGALEARAVDVVGARVHLLADRSAVRRDLHHVKEGGAAHLPELRRHREAQSPAGCARAQAWARA